jgi:hypothetical protein
MMASSHYNGKPVVASDRRQVRLVAVPALDLVQVRGVHGGGHERNESLVTADVAGQRPAADLEHIRRVAVAAVAALDGVGGSRGSSNVQAADKRREELAR